MSSYVYSKTKELPKHSLAIYSTRVGNTFNFVYNYTLTTLTLIPIRLKMPCTITKEVGVLQGNNK